MNRSTHGPPRFLAATFLLAALLLLWPGVSFAADRQTLSTHIPAAARQLTPLDRLDPTRRLNLAIGLPLRNQEALNKFLQALYDPASPSYRKYLSPAEFTERFGPTVEDYQAVADFAKAYGLTVTVTHPNRVVLDVSGTAADIEKAFHLHLRTYRHPTEARQFFAPDAEPTLDLATPVLHISGLDDYALPHPHLHRKDSAAQDQAAPKAGAGPGGGYVSNDFRAAYVPGVARTGTGQSVGLLQFDGYYQSDITTYESLFGLPNVPLVNVAIDGGVTTPSDGSAEVSLDIEMVMSMAPGVSTIYVYEAPNPSPFPDLLNRMANDNLSRQLSCSWGGGSPDPTSELIFQQMAAQGQSFFNATGDSDALSGAIDFPSESPNITQVGGTTLTTSGPGGAYVSEVVWNWGNGTGSSGGISPTYTIPVWQQGISMTSNQGSTTMRNIPDVALTADNVYVRFDNGSAGIFGGTSCAAPLWAGYLALMNEQAVQNSQPPIGFINPAIYAICKGANYNTDFHDTTTGNNFRTGSTTKFAATTGYDLCTGWGTPAGPALMAALAGSPDTFQVTPAPFAATGIVGGPFTPSSQSYTLTNNGSAPVFWTAAKSQPWSFLSATSGTLGPGATTTVTWSLNAATAALPAGNYSDTIRFSNQTRGTSQSFGLTLAIAAPRITYFPLDTDPGWTRQSPWAYGTPTGAGSNNSSFADPTSGATGTKVLGVNLTGDYSTKTGGPFYVTTGAINLSQFAKTQLRFKRWLNENAPTFAVATVDVSNDNSHWTNLYTNGDAVTENSWVPEQYDISPVADGHSTVYFRWGHRVPSHTITAYAGWNIDDIEIAGTPAAALTLALVTSNVTEGSAPFNATLSASLAPASDTIVTLFSTDPASASLPAAVTIPAGQTSVSVPVTVGNDSLLNGTRNVMLTAAAPGYVSSAASLTVNDNETAVLAVNAPATVGDVSSIEGAISLSATPTSDILVGLSSSDTTVLQVPPAIVIPAGATYTNFLISIIKPNQASAHAATITAHVTGWTDGTAMITVLPSTSTNLAVSLPANIVEGTTATGLISIGTPAAFTISVSLGSSNTGRLTVPASVSIPAGSASATFTLTAPDNAVIDGNVNVTITAGATSFTSGTGTITVLDNDVAPSLSVTAGALTASGVAGGPFNPPSQSWTLTNTGGGSLNWTASAQQPWLTVSPPSGTLTTGQNVTVTAALNTAATSLAIGNWYDTVAFSAGGAPGSATRPVSLTITPIAPIMTAEPAITGGHTNSPSWSAVTGGDLYEAQSSTDPAFSGPVSSGFIASTSTTFTGLADATLYNYRVHARRALTTTAGSWMQTNQGDFTSDAATNVTATPSGDIVLANTAQPGTLVSGVIAPAQWNAWGSLSYTVTIPSGTTLTIDVLDATGSLLAANVPTGADLSAIPAVAAQSAIALRVNLATTNGTSPTLSDWTLGYHPTIASNLDGPWSTSVSSTQDASAPVLVITSPASLTTTRSSITVQGTASDVSGVQNLTLNGVPVNTSDSFAHWSVAVQNLQLGANVLNFIATDGATPPNSATVPIQINGVIPADANGNKLPDAWEAQYGVTGSATDTFNGNGVPNLLAYALDINPTAVDTSLLPQLSIQINPADQLPYLLFTYRQVLDNFGLSYVVELSSDLSTWNPVGANLEQVNPPVMNADGLSQTVTVRIKPALGPGDVEKYVRLRVNANY